MSIKKLNKFAKTSVPQALVDNGSIPEEHLEPVETHVLGTVPATDKPEHEMVGVTHLPDGRLMVAVCTCGWRSRELYSPVSASLDFRDHVIAMMKETRHELDK